MIDRGEGNYAKKRLMGAVGKIKIKQKKWKN